MKAMQDRIIAAVTNLVLGMAVIVVASTMGNDVESNEGEQGELQKVVSTEADASLVGVDDLYVGVSGLNMLSENENIHDQKVETTDSYQKETAEVCNAEDDGTRLKRLVASEYHGMFLVNVSEYLNVRQEASDDAPVVGKIFAGQGGQVLSVEGQWAYIKSGNVVGYINKDYAWFDEDIEKHVDDVAEIYATSVVGGLRVRSAADSKSDVLDYIDGTISLKVLEPGDQWTKVLYNDGEAFIATEYITTKRVIGTGITIEEEQAAIKAEEERQAAIKAEEERKKREAQEALERAIANSNFAETVQTSGYNISEADAYLMACCVSAEVGGSSYETQLAAANIILNRLSGGYYGDTISDVLYAKNQFTVTTNGSMDRYIKKGPKETSVQAVKDAIAGNNNMVGYTNFCSMSVARFNRYAEYIIMDDTVFYHY